MAAVSGIRLRRHDQPDAAAIWAQLCRWGVEKAMLWDVAEPLREGIFPAVLASSEVYEARRGDETVAYAWLVPVAPDVPVAMAHFCGRSYDETLDAGRQLCELLRGYGLYKSLLGVIPWPYRHARRLVRELGFQEMRVPGMCNIPDHGRVVAGALVVKGL